MLAQRYVEDILVIDGNDDIDIQRMEEIKNIISSQIERRNYKVVLNLEKTEHINYSGIEMLVERLFRVRDYHGDIKLAGVNDYLRNIFIVAGAYDQFKSYDSVENAVEGFGEEGRD